MLIRFTTPAVYDFEGFGCASFGFAGSPDPAVNASRVWGNEIEGQVYQGTLEEVLAAVPQESPSGSWQAGIVLFGNCGGENEFIRKLYDKTGCAYTGVRQSDAVQAGYRVKECHKKDFTISDTIW